MSEELSSAVREEKSACEAEVACSTCHVVMEPAHFERYVPAFLASTVMQ